MTGDGPDWPARAEHRVPRTIVQNLAQTLDDTLSRQARKRLSHGSERQAAKVGQPPERSPLDSILARTVWAVFLAPARVLCGLVLMLKLSHGNEVQSSFIAVKLDTLGAVRQHRQRWSGPPSPSSRLHNCRSTRDPRRLMNACAASRGSRSGTSKRDGGSKQRSQTGEQSKKGPLRSPAESYPAAWQPLGPGNTASRGWSLGYSAPSDIQPHRGPATLLGLRPGGQIPGRNGHGPQWCPASCIRFFICVHLRHLRTNPDSSLIGAASARPWSSRLTIDNSQQFGEA